jgi:CRISPR/Cas system-associated exonuclease Cas4 (RecB family)
LRTIKLAPSDFAFLWKECKRCYWLKYALSEPIYRPDRPMAKIFHAIDGGMQNFFRGRVLSELDSSLPNIKVVGNNLTCISEAIQFEDLGLQVYIKGRVDGVGEDLDTESKSYAIIDYKTSKPKPEHLVIYSAQLHSYAFGFSKPAENSNSYKPISRIGLVVYEPKDFEVASETGTLATLKGDIVWQEIEMDKKWFSGLLRDVAELLAQPEPPDASEECEYCKYARIIQPHAQLTTAVA